MSGEPAGSVDLSWIPLGAGEASPCVRWNGRLFEAIVAHRDRRGRADLYHSALQVGLDGVTFVIELAPVWQGLPIDHGVVGEGPVGLRRLGRSRFFRYEVRRWAGGVIPDLSYAVGGPRRLSCERATAQRLLDLVPAFPTATWGRDELRTGDMWNSNSLVAWLLARSGHDLDDVQPPLAGRAPGWTAGLVVAQRLEAGRSRYGTYDPGRAPGVEQHY